MLSLNIFKSLNFSLFAVINLIISYNNQIGVNNINNITLYNFIEQLYMMRIKT